MKNAARILGIIGGIIGLLTAIAVLLFGGLGGLFELPGAGVVSGLGWLALIASIVGLVGGVIAITRPTLAGALMLGAAVVGLIAVGLFFIVAAIILAVGGALALLGRND